MRRIIFVLSFCFLAFFLSPLVRAGDDWQPISPEELKMTSEPKAPGASAIYLYRQVDRDDEKFNEIDYARIKIFTDEGRKYADVEIPYVKGFGNIKNIRAAAGHHSLLAVGLFSGSERHLFEQESRTHPIYYHYAYEDKDDVEIELPAGMQVSGLPKPQVIDGKICNYRSDVTSTNNSLHLHRDLAVNALILDSKYYGTLRNFYQQVRTGDEQQVVLSGTTSAAQN